MTFIVLRHIFFVIYFCIIRYYDPFCFQYPSNSCLSNRYVTVNCVRIRVVSSILVYVLSFSVIACLTSFSITVSLLIVKVFFHYQFAYRYVIKVFRFCRDYRLRLSEDILNLWTPTHKLIQNGEIYECADGQGCIMCIYVCTCAYVSLVKLQCGVWCMLNERGCFEVYRAYILSHFESWYSSSLVLVNLYLWFVYVFLLLDSVTKTVSR